MFGYVVHELKVMLCSSSLVSGHFFANNYNSQGCDVKIPIIMRRVHLTEKSLFYALSLLISKSLHLSNNSLA